MLDNGLQRLFKSGSSSTITSFPVEVSTYEENRFGIDYLEFNFCLILDGDINKLFIKTLTPFKRCYPNDMIQISLNTNMLPWDEFVINVKDYPWLFGFLRSVGNFQLVDYTFKNGDLKYPVFKITNVIETCSTLFKTLIRNDEECLEIYKLFNNKFIKYNIIYKNDELNHFLKITDSFNKRVKLDQKYKNKM